MTTLRVLRKGLLGATLTAALLAHGVGGCAEDEVLADGGECGNEKLEPGEDCDVDSPGCKKCREVSGWRCRDNVCKEFCGDGKIVGEEQCDPPDGASCDTSCRKAAFKEEACDMGGHWIVHQTDYSVANVGTKGIQTSSNWYYFEIEQTGEAWKVVKALNCGIIVTGSVNVKLSDASAKGLMYLNPQDTTNPAGGRIGEMREEGDGCYFTASRHYFVRGGKPSLLPTDFRAEPELSALPPLPVSSDVYDATKIDKPDLADDTDKDGSPGVAYEVSGLASGVRSVVQRDWNEYATDDSFTIAKNASEFKVRSDFRNQENIVFLKCGSGAKCPLLEAGSQPALDRPGSAVFRYLGKSFDDPRVQEIITAPAGSNADADFEVCKRIQAALPHDSSVKQ